MYCDSHCHLDWLPKKGLSIDEEIKKAKGKNLKFVVQSIDSFEDNFSNINLAKRYPNFVFLLSGVHPQKSTEVKEGWFEKLESLIIRNQDLIVGIGEIGIDLHYENLKENLKNQTEVFERCVDLAIKLSIPVSVHSWDSFDETFEVLKKYKGKVSGVIHSFSYGKEEAKRIVSELDFFISFTGSLTYPKNYSLREALRSIPKDKIICETDAPFMPPQKFRGKPNSPHLVTEIYDFIEKEIGLEKETITNNSFNLFRVKTF